MLETDDPGLLQLGTGIVVLLLSGLMLINLIPGDLTWIVGLTVGLVLAGAGWRNHRRHRQGETMVDERIEQARERAGYTAYQVTLALEGVLLAASAFGLLAVRIDAVLSLLITVTAGTFAVQYYRHDGGA